MWQSDAGYANFGRGGWEVKLDGTVIERVFTADTDLGEVVCAKMDAAGHLVLDGDEVATLTLRGHVEIRPL